MNIVLLEPEIPYNTGNIGRSCVATGSALHLIKPLGFEINDKYLKRAGLDYWQNLDLHIYESFKHFKELNPEKKIYMLTTKARKMYTEVKYDSDCFIMFGKESAGIPEEILLQNKENCVRIPMLPDIRSLNLSNAVAVVLFEAIRQNNFDGLQFSGELHRLSWD